MKLVEIKSWFDGKVLFSGHFGSIKLCVEAAVVARASLVGASLDGANLDGASLVGASLVGASLDGASLVGASLDGANLDGASLVGASLDGANLDGASLDGANLDGASLVGASLDGASLDVPCATPAQSIENLDKVREIILDNKELLDMGHWHADDSEWEEHTCAEEAVCGTTHCLAGWLQVCSTDDKVRKLAPYVAGVVCAPVAAKMFYAGTTEALSWLRERKYVEELAEAAK